MARTASSFSTTTAGCLGLLAALLVACERPVAPGEPPSAAEAPDDAWRRACLRDSTLPGLARETVPDLDLQLDGLSVRTGSLGQRGSDSERDPRAFRLAALGGGFTFGLGLDQGRDWPTQFAAHIDRSILISGRHMAVTNLGTLDADLTGLAALAAARLGEDPPWIAVFELDLGGWGAVPDAAGWQAVESALGDLAARFAPAGVGLVLMITPLDAGRPWAEYPLGNAHRDLARAAERHGLAVVDLLPAFAREPLGSLRGESTPPHWNERAQAVAMDALKRKLFETGLLSMALEAHGR